jgi:hypothetical protein
MRCALQLPAAALAVAAHAATATVAKALWDSPSIQVLRSNDVVHVRSAFSPEHDVVVSVGVGRNGQLDFDRAGLVPEGSPMTFATCAAAELVHGCNDDSTPWNVNDTYIGANHGWFGVREVTSPKHGLAAPAALGSAWSDEKGAKWYVAKVLDADRLWMMPDNVGTHDRWRFHAEISGSALEREGGGQTLAIQGSIRTQLVPSCRVKGRQYLVDGKVPLPEREVVSCARLDVAEEYDIVNPAAALATLKAEPGRAMDLVGPMLEPLVTNRILYRFQPMGACLVEHRSTVHAAMTLGYMGFVQSRTLVRKPGDALVYLVPGSLPFVAQGRRYDFRAGQDFSELLKTPVQFGPAQGNVESAERLPSRFIQVLQRKEGGKVKFELGYALGYSLSRGVTRPAERAANCETALLIHTSNKSYPHAIDRKMGRLAAGATFEALAYRQYFSPRALGDGAACAYWHQEDDGVVVCAEYLQAVAKDALRLPKALAGRAVSVVEATPSVKLLSGATVPADGLVLSVGEGGGSIVLKLSGGTAR